MRELRRRSNATALIGRGVLSLATAWLFASQAAAQTFVRPGETVSVPTIIKNADDNGEPGGDTISSMKVVVTGDSAFVTSPTDSETLSIAPGEAKTFSPKFVVGSGPGVVDGQTYKVRLKLSEASEDKVLLPDPEILDLVTSFPAEGPQILDETVPESVFRQEPFSRVKCGLLRGDGHPRERGECGTRQRLGVRAAAS